MAIITSFIYLPADILEFDVNGNWCMLERAWFDDGLSQSDV
jgi:hypothetical protein